MAQLSDDCFAHGGALMTVPEALEMLRSRTEALVATEACRLPDALGRVLAEDIIAPASVPPHPNSAVDGYAVSYGDLSEDSETRLKIGGRLPAGDRPAEHYEAGTALRIFTGAILPPGFDTVFMQEDCSLEQDDTIVVLPKGLKKGSNARAAGEDILKGETLLKKGHRLRGVDLGFLSSAGYGQFRVYTPLKIALFSTGNELHDPVTRTDDASLPEGAIFDSNRYTLLGFLKSRGITVTDLGILPDDGAAMKTALADAAREHDLVMTSGGVSVGEEDHVKDAIGALGSIHAWRLAIKPGRPIAFGQIGSTPFIGMPGNPVAVVVTFLGVVWPFLCHLSHQTYIEPMGQQLKAGFKHKKKKDRREWVRASCHLNSDGTVELVKYPRDGAGVLSSVCLSDGLIELPENALGIESGDLVTFYSFRELGL
ncbi:molybdopterin molybdotransferase MoeA [Kiloniella sp. b19]|uniref:molybdopterin molybdotransferase MoeA n=1 Tax=Kiloniella sp. GXU_MW_B19 TaxID=3141326 RepID=UPI0031E4233C